MNEEKAFTFAYSTQHRVFVFGRDSDGPYLIGMQRMNGQPQISHTADVHLSPFLNGKFEIRRSHEM